MKIKMKRLNPWFSPKTASKQLKLLKPAFEQLSRVHGRYIKAERAQDFSYCHRERSQVGLLAAAIWRLGRPDATALEEYSARKRKGRKKVMGRCDLYINAEGQTFECEVKSCEVNLGRPIAAFDDVAESLGEAVKEAGRLVNADSRHLALCFATPWINQRSAETDMRWNEFIERLKATNGGRRCDALVEVYGKPFPEDKPRRYPGIVLVVREVGKQGKHGG